MLGLRDTSYHESSENLMHTIAEGTADDVAKALIAWRQPVDSVFPKGGNPLWTAVLRRGRFDWTDWEGARIVRLLLSAGANPNLAGSYGCTPIFYVHSPEIATELINGGADVNHSNEFGDRALNYIVYANKIDVMKVLLDAGGETVNDRNHSPLQLAASMGLPGIVATLLRRKMSSQIKTYRSADSLLHLAVKSGCKRTVRVLLDHGLSPDEKNDYGVTPRELAEEISALGMASNYTWEAFVEFETAQRERQLRDVAASVIVHRSLWPESMEQGAGRLRLINGLTDHLFNK